MINKKLDYNSIIKLPLVRVKWIDATDQTFTLKELEELPNTLLTERVTVGFLYKTLKDKIIIIKDITKDEDCEISCVPKPWVIL